MTEIQGLMIKIIIAIVTVPTITAIIAYYYYKKYIGEIYKDIQ